MAVNRVDGSYPKTLLQTFSRMSLEKRKGKGKGKGENDFASYASFKQRSLREFAFRGITSKYFFGRISKARAEAMKLFESTHLIWNAGPFPRLSDLYFSK